MSKPDTGKLEQEVTGKTFQVYWRLLTKRQPVGIREIQKELKLSSPSVAIYHLEKLKRLGLVQENAHGQYALVQEVKVGLLHFFTGFRNYLFPRHLLYLGYFISLLLSYVLLFKPTLTIPNIYIAIFGLSAILMATYEVIKSLRMAP